MVAICGDGSYLFSQPSTVHWLARAYQAPFLHVVLNNGGWRAPRQAVLSVHPDGIAARAPNIDIHFPEPPDYAAIAAAAGGAHPENVRSVAEVKPALERALRAIRDERRAAVIDAHVPDRPGLRSESSLRQKCPDVSGSMQANTAATRQTKLPVRRYAVAMKSRLPTVIR